MLHPDADLNFYQLKNIKNVLFFKYLPTRKHYHYATPRAEEQSVMLA